MNIVLNSNWFSFWGFLCQILIAWTFKFYLLFIADILIARTWIITIIELANDLEIDYFSNLLILMGLYIHMTFNGNISFFISWLFKYFTTIDSTRSHSTKLKEVVYITNVKECRARWIWNILLCWICWICWIWQFNHIILTWSHTSIIKYDCQFIAFFFNLWARLSKDTF